MLVTQLQLLFFKFYFKTSCEIFENTDICSVSWKTVTDIESMGSVTDIYTVSMSGWQRLELWQTRNQYRCVYRLHSPAQKETERKIKVSCVPKYYATKAYLGNKRRTPHILILGTRRRWVVSFTFQSPYTQWITPPPPTHTLQALTG
jgi:hypothetical protein